MALSANTEAFGGSNAYVAIGFRPLSLSNNSSFIAAGTGIPQEFGMRGADIVLGGAEGGIKTFYAAEYTGFLQLLIIIILLKYTMQLLNLMSSQDVQH